MTLDEIRAMLAHVNQAAEAAGEPQLTLVNSVPQGGLIFMEVAADNSLRPAHSEPANRREAGFFLHGRINRLAAEAYAADQ